MRVWLIIKTISANKKKGFTLIELLAVIVILGTLAVLGTISVLRLVDKSKEKVFKEEALTIINAARTKSAETIVPDEGICYSLTDLKGYIEKDLSSYSGSVYVSGNNNYKIWLSKNPYIITAGTLDNINIVKLASYVPASEMCPSSFVSITINTNQGTLSSNIPTIAHEGQQITLTDPIKAGDTFMGWTVLGEGSSITNNVLTVGSEDLVLSANWQANSYTLTVNANGGTWSGTSPQTILSGGSSTINNPTKAYYNFNGWTVTGANSSINGTTFTMGSENTVLTAKWTANYYSLTVNANGGTWSGTTPQTIAYGSTSVIPNPTKASYVFVGWTVTGANSSINGTTFTMGNENTTISANWVIAVVNFSASTSLQTYNVTANGRYKIELWGAACSGAGGYTKGEIILTSGNVLYFNVSSTGYPSDTDVRYNAQTLYDRIMVAGGGGCGGAGAGGGAGGGLTGREGGCTGSEYISGCLGAGGGTQTSGGSGGRLWCDYINTAYWVYGNWGSFRAGGIQGGSEWEQRVGGPAGNGYWGGGGGAGCNNGSSIQGGTGGGGGSSFISGHTGCVAVVSSSSTSPRTGTGGAGCGGGSADNLCSIHYSGKYFTNTVMIDGLGYAWTNVVGGATPMPNPAGSYYASGGNTGAGYARITYISAS